jgi:uncharacterized protein YunC (DUF1805 family)
LVAVPCATADFSWSGLVCEQVRGLKRPFLVIRGAKGFAACGYVNPDGAAAVGDACATFSGVGTHEDILHAKAVAVTPQAVQLGASVGMLGCDFLDLVRGDVAPTPPTPATTPIGNPSEGATPFGWSDFVCSSVPGLKRPFLVICSQKGFAGCGYMSTSGATKCGDAFALFRGVSVHHDILDAKVVEVSEAAKELGSKPGMTGREYLALIR